MTIAIGDIHGCLEPLQALVAQLPPREELVFLGDYVDRGPQSAQVIDYLQWLSLERPCRLLTGNHEAMMAAACEDPEEISIWLFNGGDATLASYGQSPRTWQSLPERERLVPGFMDFYRKLALYHEDDRAIYVHAGLDVAVPTLAEQDPNVLLWIRERFFNNAGRWHGKPIFFGHTPTLYLGLPAGEIFRKGPLFGIDTGCVYGGCLTAIDTVTLRLYQAFPAPRDAPGVP
jgi:serine/threonine protein phosphatase 1